MQTAEFWYIMWEVLTTPFGSKNWGLYRQDSDPSSEQTDFWGFKDPSWSQYCIFTRCFKSEKILSRVWMYGVLVNILGYSKCNCMHLRLECFLLTFLFFFPPKNKVQSGSVYDHIKILFILHVRYMYYKKQHYNLFNHLLNHKDLRLSFLKANRATYLSHLEQVCFRRLKK